MIKHHARLTARAQNPVNLTHGPGGVRRVMQDAVGVNNVETLVCEWQGLTVADRKITALSANRKMPARNLNRTRGQINSGNSGTAARKLQQIRAHATAHFEQAGAGEFIEAHDCGHPRSVLGVAMTLDLVEKLAAAKFLLAPVDRSAGIFAPLLAGALLFVRDWIAVISHRIH